MSAQIPFRARRLVRFADCDPAGIVYFPRYFDFMHGAIEDWMRDGLSFDYWRMIEQRRIGMPFVNAECDFHRPSRMGDQLTIEIRIERLGNSSLITRHCLKAGEELRAEGRLVQVAANLGGEAAIPIPADLRDCLAAYAAATGAREPEPIAAGSP